MPCTFLKPTPLGGIAREGQVAFRFPPQEKAQQNPFWQLRASGGAPSVPPETWVPLGLVSDPFVENGWPGSYLGGTLQIQYHHALNFGHLGSPRGKISISNKKGVEKMTQGGDRGLLNSLQRWISLRKLAECIYISLRPVPLCDCGSLPSSP